MAESGRGGPSGAPRPQMTLGSGRGILMSRRPPGTVSTPRLPSMRSRDLTLGGVKKKTFTPNIIGRKVKDDSVKEDAGRPHQGRKEGERGRGRDGRGRGRGRPEVIQSHSIFEQGPAEMMMKKRGSYDGGDRDAPSMGPSPIINIKKEKRETEEETKEILRMLERDSFLDDPHLSNDMRSCPVQLPLAVSGWTFKEELQKVKVKKEEEEAEDMDVDNMDTIVKVKQEPPDAIEVKKSEPLYKPPTLPESESLPDLLKSWGKCKGEELFLIQLPDTLPGQPPTREARPVKTEVQSEGSQSILLKTEDIQEDEQDDNICTLRDLGEGLIGRMLVRQSGRVQLILGKITLDLAVGTPCAFLQELVSIGTDEGRSGDLTVLGHIKHKLVCSPDFQALLA